MKITLERLREIITEEVIKEEVSPEDATRTIVALLQGTESKVTAEIMGAVYDDMYDPDAGELEPDYEPDPEAGDPIIGIGQRGKTRAPDTGTGEMGFRPREKINEIIQEELRAVLRENEVELQSAEDKKRLEIFRSTGASELLVQLMQRLGKSTEGLTDEELAELMASIQTLLSGDLPHGDTAEKRIAESTVFDIEIIND